jgi:hypothetical protein
MGKTASLANIGSIADSSLGFRNRIINGAMVIDQRNAGASVTNTTSSVFTVDRFFIYGAVSSKFTAQQNAGSVTPPVGFTNYLGCTSSSAYSVGAGESFSIYHNIEGFNLADFGWGTANAQTATLSFWVRSSLTGTFSVTLRNNAQNRSYPATYTISSANTWEQKSITIVGETSGTWVTNNGLGVALIFNLGSGASASTTANAWASANYVAATGATSVVGTNGATFYITGVQLEKGATATAFDYRSYGTELALCYRYYEQILYGTGINTGNGMIAIGQAYSTSAAQVPYTWTTTKRASPTISTSSASTSLYGATGTAYAATLSFLNINPQTCYMNASQNSGTNLIAGNATLIYASTGLYVQISSEL